MNSQLLLLTELKLRPSNLRYATFETYPCLFDDRESWVLFDPGWTKIPVQDAKTQAHSKTKAQFDKLFSQLPPLPKAAFQTGE
jgi:hypothetical protein